MIDLEFKVEYEGIDEVRAKLHPQAAQKAITRTINELGSKALTQLRKDIRKRYNIQNKTLKKYIKIKRAKYKNMTYVIDVDGKRRNVVHFSPKVLKKKGHVSVKIKKSSGRKTLVPAFYTKNKKAILRRVRHSQDIEPIQTIAISQMFRPYMIDKAFKQIRKDVKQRLHHNLEFYISKEK